MHNARSGARAQHRKIRDEEVLSPAQALAFQRGQALKRVLRAAAALHDLYDDTALGKAVGVVRGAIRAWWEGAQMQPDTLRRAADATGLSPDELTRFVYFDGPPPTLVPSERFVLEADRRAVERRGRTAPSTPPQPPERRPRGSGAGRG